jgi:hypothetical protein
MSLFIKPKGVNFSCTKELPAVKLSKILCRTTSFIQQLEPYAKLERYDDWWEHDGLHFYRKSIKIEELFTIVNSPKSLLESMPGDFDVSIGLAPENQSWYLRFYLDWDEDDNNLVGRFDVTFSSEIAKNFKAEVLSKFDFEMVEQDSESYYQTIT